jgi:tRNA dimethylallyltransferase
MDIGTAKPTKTEQKGIHHHLLDIVEPGEYFTVADFKEQALEAMDGIAERDKLAIMVGGTGLYIDSVLFDYQFNQPAAERDEQNPRHLKKTNEPRLQPKLRTNTLILGLSIERKALEERIRQRVEAMIENGLMREVERLDDKYDPQIEAFKTTGYRAIRAHLQGEISLEEAKERFVRADLQFAKRQRTWFKRNKSIQWLTDQNEAFRLIEHFLENNNIT